MANFTETEANACTITRLEKKMEDGSYTGMVIGVTDADGNYYDWIDNSLNEDAYKSTIKKAIKNHLTNNVEKIPAPIIVNFEQIEDKGKGETVG